GFRAPRLLLLFRGEIREQFLDIVGQLIRYLSGITFIVAVHAAPHEIATLAIHQIDDEGAFGKSKSFEAPASTPSARRAALSLPFVRCTEAEIHNEVRASLCFLQTFGHEL